MSGNSSRDKGARGELAAAAALRSLNIHAERCGRIGLNAADLQHGLWGLHLEVKYQSNPSLWKAMRQAEEDSRGLLTPMVLAKMVGKRGSSEWMVMHKLSDWPAVAASFVTARSKGLPDAPPQA